MIGRDQIRKASDCSCFEIGTRGCWENGAYHTHAQTFQFYSTQVNRPEIICEILHFVRGKDPLENLDREMRLDLVLIKPVGHVCLALNNEHLTLNSCGQIATSVRYDCCMFTRCLIRGL